MPTTNQHFGFRENPFNRAPDPRFFFAEGESAAGYNGLREALQGRHGVFMVTGDHGTGKTMLLRRLETDVRPELTSLPVYFSSVSYQELLKTLCDRLQCPFDNADLETLPKRLRDAALAEAPGAEGVVLLIDDAQNLGATVLEALPQLVGRPGRKGAVFRVVLAGLPELETLMDPGTAPAVADRLVTHLRLRPLDRDAVTGLIRHRLRVVGGDAEVMPESTIDRIFVHSGGLPGRVVALCDHAMFEAAQGDKRTITPSVVETVVAERSLEERRAVMETEDPASAPAPSASAPGPADAATTSSPKAEPGNPPSSRSARTDDHDGGGLAGAGPAPPPYHQRPHRTSRPRARTGAHGEMPVARRAMAPLLVGAAAGAVIMLVAVTLLSPHISVADRSELAQTVADLEQENLALAERIAELESAGPSVAAGSAESRNAMARLRGELAAMTEQKDWLARKLARHEAQAILIQSALDSIERDRDDAVETSPAQAVADVIRERNTLRRDLNRLDLEVANLRADLARFGSSESDQAFIQQLSAENATLQQQVQDLSATVADLEQALAAATEDRRALADKVEGQENRQDQLTALLESQKQALGDSLADAEQRIAVLTGENQDLEARLDALSGADRESERLVEALATMREERARLEQRLADLEAERDRLASAVATLDTASAGAAESADPAVAPGSERQTMIGRIVVLTRERDALAERLAAAEAEIEELREAAFTRRRR